MQVEHIAGVGLPPGGAAQQQRHLAVGPGVLGQVVIDDEDILALLHKGLAHSAAGIGGDELQRRGVGGTGVDDDGVFQRAVFLQDAHHLGNFALLLADGDIDADEVGVALVDDGVNGDGGFACGAVADDEFPLAASDGDHRINGLDAGLDGGVHGFADHDVGGGALYRHLTVGEDGAFAVQRPAQGVDDAADEGVADGDFNNLPGGAHPVTLFNGVGIAEDGGADDVRFQVEGQAEDAVAKVQQLVGADALQALDAGDAVAHLDDGADIHQGQVAAEFLNLAPDEGYDFLSSDCHRPVSLCCLKLPLRRAVRWLVGCGAACGVPARPCTALGGGGAHRLAHPCQCGGAATVQQAVANLDNQAAEDTFVNLDGDDDRAARQPGYEVGNPCQFVIVRRHGGGNQGAAAAQVFVQQPGVAFLDGGHRVHAAPGHQQGHQVAHQGMGFGKHGAHGGHFALGRHFGVFEEGGEIVVAQHVVGQPQVAVPLLRLLVGNGQFKDGLGVALCRQAGCHGSVPPSDFG